MTRAMAIVRDGELHYLEHVTEDVEGTCALLTALHGWRFGAPDALLGGARVAVLPSGTRCGVRGPLRPDEAPVTRTYVRVPSVKRAAARAAKKGAVAALGAMKLGEHGTIDILIQHGVEHGVWELPKPKKRPAKKAARTRAKGSARN